MTVFAYKAVGASGQTARGRMDARNEIDLEARLRRLHLDLVSARPLSEAAGRLHRVRVSRQERLALCFDLEQIVRAGLPIVEGLRDLGEACEQSDMRLLVAGLVEEMEGGRTLSQAMSGFPSVFDAVFVSLIRAGEQSGSLEEILVGLGKSLRWQDELIAQTKKLLIYPALVCAVVLAVTVFLLVYLVPQVVSLLRTMGTDLPLQTRLLIAVSDVVVRWWWLCILAPVACAAAVAHTIRHRPSLRVRFDAWKLRVPVFGPILRKIMLARFASAFALMYRSGIDILDALRSCEEIVGNRSVALALREAASRIQGGHRLSEAFAGISLFPALVLRMVRMGETTGALDTALTNVHYFYERDVRESIDRSLKAIEPVLTLLLGGILALVLFAILTPLYEVIGRIPL